MSCPSQTFLPQLRAPADSKLGRTRRQFPSQTCLLRLSSGRDAHVPISKNPTAPEGKRVGSSCECRSSYCLSYMAVLLTFLPFASLPWVVRVRALPSFETTIFPVTTDFPSFLLSRLKVR